MLNRRCIFLIEGAIKFLSWRKLASEQGVNQGDVAGQGSGREDLGRGGCEAAPCFQSGLRGSAQLGIRVYRHPQISPRDDASPGGSDSCGVQSCWWYGEGKGPYPSPGTG